MWSVMILPVAMLRNLQMPNSKKLGLACIFFLGLVIVLFDILRIALGDGGGIISLASLWDALEPTSAVIVSTLPTYRTLFPSGKTSAKRNMTSYESDLSDSQQSWKKRVTARHRNEGYDLSEDVQELHPKIISGESRSIPSQKGPSGAVRVWGFSKDQTWLYILRPALLGGWRLGFMTATLQGADRLPSLNIHCTYCATLLNVGFRKWEQEIEGFCACRFLPHEDAVPLIVPS